MKQLTMVAILAMAGCKLDPSLLEKPGGGGPVDEMPGDPIEGGHGSTSHAVDSDLCKVDDSLDAAVQLQRQEQADRTTICTMITVPPADGVARVEPRAPGWCDKLPAGELDTSRMIWATSGMQALVEERYWWATTREILGPLCGNPDDPNVRQQTAYFYQWWVNKTGMPPEELDGLFRYFGSFPTGDGALYATAQTEMCAAFPAASAEASDRDQLLARATRASLGCSDSAGTPYWVAGGSGDDLWWHLDAAAEAPSQLLRAYAVLGCLWDHETIEDRHLGNYAACGADGRDLDAAALEREIADWHELAQAHARMTVAAARKVTARYQAVARARADADPAWQELLYDAPARGWKAWEAAYAAERDAVDAARAYEARYFGPSRKAARGCWDEAWGNLTRHAAKAGAKDLPGAKAAMTDPIGTILLEHVTACADAEGWESRATLYGQLFEHARPARGPRHAAYYAMIDALSEILADRERFTFDTGWLGGLFTARSPIARSGGGSVDALDLARDDQGGVVKKVKKVKGGVIVEYKSEKWKDAIYSCTRTDRIQQLRPDGTVIYEEDCTYQGSRWVEDTHDPIFVPGDLADGIEPGRFLRASISWEKEQDAAKALPVEVWADKERETLVAYLGVAP
jgi:hypothetical protein